ncbi:MFS transporter [Gimesia maris]|uniref:MFS transporter n=1 Tax=Gimesia maris TaxID=122 RepID=UPI003A8E7276
MSETELKTEELPPLYQDSSFWGMTVTQFWGAFNDNLYKQLVLLFCAQQALQLQTDDRQGTALAVFALPFVFFSGLGGWYADRHTKRTIVIACKVAEIIIALLAMAAFFTGELLPLLIVLGLLSTQSAIFGPAKYGILPEMLRDDDLPQANGIIQMTTFIAIIFGMASAGFVKQAYPDQLWKTSYFCIGIAVIGTISSLWVRRTPVAHPGLPFSPSTLGIDAETRGLLRNDRRLLSVLLISSVFWFVGGIVQPLVNIFGIGQLHISESRTSLMAACMGVGISLGCIVAGRASRKRVNFKLVTTGAWGLVVCLAVMAGFGWWATPETGETLQQTDVSLWASFIPLSTTEWLARGVLTLLGFFAGLFVVPLQVELQTRPPKSLKGRMIGAMNLINWIGIVLSALFFGIFTKVLNACNWPMSNVFLFLAAVILPIAILYHPKDEILSHDRP